VTRLPVAAFVALVIATVGAFFVTQHLKVTTPLIAGSPSPHPAAINPVNGKTCLLRNHLGVRVPVSYKHMQISFYLLHRADDVDVYVVDQNGNIVDTLASGRHMSINRRRLFTWNGRTSKGTIAPDVALGCAVYPHDAKDATGLLACAFAALPKSGALNPGALNFFSSANTEAARRTFLLEQGLRNAINDDQFFLEYQPVVDVSRARVVGAEALLRWRHPELGLVSPAEFIPILEQSGPIDEVGLWVLNTACRDARRWRRRGLAELTIAVNLSACQFRGPTLAMTIVRTLERHGLAPSDLEVELTETAAMEDGVRTREVLEQLRALGVGVAIDDFGAGYSSLSYLKNLPFTKLKIDREFVVKVHERPDSQAICAALVALANGLNIKLLAEGAEAREEVETLVRLGCSMFQGYFFAKPQSADDFVLTVSDAAWLDTLDLGAADLRAPPRRRRA